MIVRTAQVSSCFPRNAHPTDDCGTVDVDGLPGEACPQSAVFAKLDADQILLPKRCHYECKKENTERRSVKGQHRQL